MAILARLAFFYVLKVTETCRLRKKDCMFPSMEQPQLVLAILEPKNAQYMGKYQYSITNDLATIRWVEWMPPFVENDQSIWPGDSATFRKWFNAVLSRIGVGVNAQTEHKSTPGGLRSGGATYHMLNGEAKERLLGFGRWKSNTSLNIYLQEAMSTFVWGQMKAQDQEDLKALVCRLRFIWDHPPELPPSYFIQYARPPRKQPPRVRSQSRPPAIKQRPLHNRDLMSPMF